MVALDTDEEKSKMLVDGALKLAVSGRDSLLMARVIPEMEMDTTVVILDPSAVLEERMKNEAAERKKLEELNKPCFEAKVESWFVVITDDNPGFTLCKLAKEYKIDCMLVGRRKLGAIKRFFTCSISKYCVDHADCNVLVLKKPYSSEEAEKPIREDEKPISEEEKEKRQMASEGPTVLPTGNRILTLRTPAELQRVFSQVDERHSTEKDARKVESAKDLDLVCQLEEEARAERIKDLQEEQEKEGTQRNLERTLSLEKLRIAEEQERAYRIRKQEEENTRERVLTKIRSREDRELTRKMEEEEQERRIQELKEISNSRLQESKEDLAFVVALEETERERRVHLSNQ